MAGKTYYVSGTGNDKNSGLKEQAAFRTLQKAADLVEAGDTVYIMNGTYTSPYSSILNIANKHGTADAPITFTAYPGHTPVLEAHKNIWNGVSIFGSSYIVVEGLTLVGARDEITLEYALEQKENTNNPATSGNGISVGIFKSKSTGVLHSDHITINNNNVSKFPGAGIVTTQADYITVTNNVVSGNAWYSPHGNQGITMFELWNSDNNVTDYKVIIQGNTSFDNKQLVPWVVVGKITEGHGIMLDTSYVGNVAYQGKTLISENLIYNNGGAAIQLFKGINPVDIVNNTTYHNSQTLSKGEIFLNSVKNISLSNNIMYASNGGSTLLIENSTNTTLGKNIAYNGAVKAKGVRLENIINKDPLFVDAANRDFRLKSGSPAIDAGSNVLNGMTNKVAQDGDSNGTAVIDMGTYEAGIKAAPEMQVLNGTNDSEYLKGNAPANKIYALGKDDTIIGNFANDQLWGGDGNDTLWGQNGNDQLFGDSGNDWLLGGKGNDVLTGGSGVDTFVLASGEGTDSIIDFKVGTDLISLSGGLKFGQLVVRQDGSQSLIVNSSDNVVLAKLDAVSAVSLLAQSSTSFITV